jgi:ATP phosphoribosyltransferase
MPTARNVKRPGDATGRIGEALAKEHAEELKARENEISLLNAQVAAERDDTVHDVTPKDFAPAPEPAAVEVSAVEVQVPTREFRVNTTIENMTFGHGNHYDFEEGVRYKAEKPLYDHLDSLGYVWH